MSGKKRPGKKGLSLPTGNPSNPLVYDLSGPFYEGFAVKSEPGQGKKNFPAPSRYWKRYKFERKSLNITGELPDGNKTIQLPGL